MPDRYGEPKDAAVRIEVQNRVSMPGSCASWTCPPPTRYPQVETMTMSRQSHAQGERFSAPSRRRWRRASAGAVIGIA